MRRHPKLFLYDKSVLPDKGKCQQFEVMYALLSISTDIKRPSPGEGAICEANAFMNVVRGRADPGGGTNADAQEYSCNLLGKVLY